jgi:acyl-CoA thioester hydrolase
MKRIDPNSPLQSSHRLRIPFNDLDPAGMVWHGRYFKYFECARSQLMDEVGYGYAQMHESGYLWPVVDVNVRYLKPLLLNQNIVVTAVLQEWELRLKVDHEIVNENGDVCARATTIQVPVHPDSMEIRIGAPKVLIDKVEARLNCAAVEPD